jgi:O-acetylserine/cysteine efflux transporter
MRLHHLAFILIINMIWGLSFIAIKYTTAELSPFLINSLRFLIVALALFPFLKVIRGQMRDTLLVAIVLGVFNFGIMVTAVSIAGGVSEIAIVSQLGVPFSTLLAIIMLGEVVHIFRIMGIVVSFLGVVIMGFDPKVFAHIDAMLLIALSALLYAYANILMRKLKNIPAMTLQAWVGIVGFVGSVLLSAILETGQIEAVKNLSSTAIWALFYSAIGASVIGHSGMNYLLRHYEVSVVSPYMLMMPVFGVLGGVFILDEILTPRIIIGGVLTLAGVGLITLRNQMRKVKIQVNTEIV